MKFKSQYVFLAAAIFVSLTIVITLLLTYCRKPDVSLPSPSPYVTASQKPSTVPSISSNSTLRPSYPNDIFGTTSSISSLPSVEPSAESTVYPGAEDLPNGVAPPPYELQPGTPIPIYQDGSVSN